MKQNISLRALSFTLFSLFSFGLLAQEATLVELKDRYPNQGINRPGIMPVGIIGFETRAKTDLRPSIALSEDVKFGIVEHLEGQFGYRGTTIFKYDDNKTTEKTSNFALGDEIYLGAKYNYLSVPHVSLSASVKVPFHFYGHIVRNIELGFPVTFFNDFMAGGLVPGANFTVRGASDADKAKAVAVSFDYWIGAQVIGDLWVEMSSSIGSFKTEESNNYEWTKNMFWQELPLTFEALYGVNHCMDVGAQVGFKDALKPDTVFFGGLLTLRAGRFFG